MDRHDTERCPPPDFALEHAYESGRREANRTNSALDLRETHLAGLRSVAKLAQVDVWPYGDEP